MYVLRYKKKKIFLVIKKANNGFSNDKYPKKTTLPIFVIIFLPF